MATAFATSAPLVYAYFVLLCRIQEHMSDLQNRFPETNFEKVKQVRRRIGLISVVACIIAVFFTVGTVNALLAMKDDRAFSRLGETCSLVSCTV